MKTKNIGIYIHIPFCKRKCEYCDFVSYSNCNNLIPEYVKWLKYEIREIGDSNKLDFENGLDDFVIVKTIYIGGGTPSVVDECYIREIMQELKNHFTISEDAEITIEVNPGTVDERKLASYRKSGINRLSIGLQSTNDKLLKLLGRIHSYEEFLSTYNMARKVGFSNINVDLMIGLPQQKLEDVEKTIEEIIKLNPEHISAYSLIIEEGTPFEKKIESGELQLPDEEVERKMYWLVKKKLEEAGYNHYEISNFAKLGYESKHNTSCWNQEEYIGIGVAAHSYTNNVRYSTIESISEYINNFETNNESDNLIFHEKQNRESKMKEFMLLGLRKLKRNFYKGF